MQSRVFCFVWALGALACSSSGDDSNPSAQTAAEPGEEPGGDAPSTAPSSADAATAAGGSVDGTRQAAEDNMGDSRDTPVRSAMDAGASESPVDAQAGGGPDASGAADAGPTPDSGPAPDAGPDANADAGGVDAAVSGPPSPCLSDRECTPHGQLCNSERGRCYTPCDNSLDCQLDEVCDAEGQCSECATSLDCPEHHVCNAGLCRLPCSLAEPDTCPVDQVCRGGYCSAPCTSDEECGGDRRRCNLQSGLCENAPWRFCEQTRDCAPDELCSPLVIVQPPTLHCTKPCSSGCPPVPDGWEASCVAGPLGGSACAIRCTEDGLCPEGMACDAHRFCGR